MNLRNLYSIIITGLMFFLPVNGQNKDKAVFIVPKPGFYQNSILKDDREVKEQITPLKENNPRNVVWQSGIPQIAVAELSCVADIRHLEIGRHQNEVPIIV